MKDSCSALSKLLGKYFDQEVTNQERSLVEAHLLDCQACRDELMAMEELRTFIKVPVEEAVKQEDFPWVWQKIEKEIRSRERSSLWQILRSYLNLRFLIQRRVLIPAMATIAVLLFLTTQLVVKKTPSLSYPSVVEYVESDRYHIIVYESEKANMTVIWLFEAAEQNSSTS